MKINFILKREVLPTNYYISLKDRILLNLGKKRITGWYNIEKNEINIHLANLWIRHKKNFKKELIKSINHEMIHYFIENNFSKRVIQARVQEELIHKELNF